MAKNVRHKVKAVSLEMVCSSYAVLNKTKPSRITYQIILMTNGNKRMTWIIHRVMAFAYELAAK